MRRLLLVVIMFLMFMGVVSASSINGDYKGNPIVKILSNGKELQLDEVPGMIYDGHTVVPISLLRQIGASVNWNADTYSVDIKINNQPSISKEKLLNFANDCEMYRYITFMTDQMSLVNIITEGIIPTSRTPDQYSQALLQVNRLQVDFSVSWVNTFSKINYYNDDIQRLNDINRSFSAVKNGLLKFDVNSTNNDSNSIRINLNMLYAKYDSKLKEDESAVFSSY